MPKRTKKKTLTAHKNFSGVMLAILSALGFSFLGILAKFVYKENVSVEALLCFRMLVSAIVIWIYILIFRADKKKKSKMGLSAYFFSGLFGFYLSAFFGLESIIHINVGLAVILYNTFPAFVIIISAFLDRKLPPLSHFIVLLLTQIGIFMVVGAGGAEAKNLFNGVLFSLASSFASAIYILLNQKVAKKVDTMEFVARSIFFAAIFSTLHFILTRDLSEIYMTKTAYFYAIISGACFTISYIFFSESIRIIGASKASLINSISPVFAVIFAFLILGEVLTMKQIIGGIIILLAILLLKKRSLVILRKKKTVGM